MIDVIIAGGGVAGSSLAIQLGRAGLQVELYEQHVFPREKACAEGLMPAGVAVLRRLGLADEIGGAPLEGVRYHGWNRSVQTAFPAAPGIAPVGLGQRRIRLDAHLFRTARATAGVQAFDGVRVEAPLVESSRVRGVRVDGVTRRARLVVAADGPRSPLRHALRLDRKPRGRERLGARAHFRLAAGQPPSAFVEVFLGDDHELYLTPLPDNEVALAALGDRLDIGGNTRSLFARWIQHHPALSARLEGAEQLTDLAGRTPLTTSASDGAVPGLVLLGDAAGFVDPVTGTGMAQALLSAEFLAKGLGRPGGAGLSDDALLEFDRNRNRMLRDHRLLTGFVLQLVRRPWLACRMLETLRLSPELYQHLVGVAAGTRPLLPG